MPYHVRKDSDCPADRPWAVVDDNNHKYGCHASAEEARGQQNALYAAEPTLRKEVDRPRLLQAILDLGSFLARSQESDVNFYDTPELAKAFSLLEIPALAPAQLPEYFPPTPKAAADLFKEQHKVIAEVAYPPVDFAIVRDRNRPETWGILLAEGTPGTYTPSSLQRAAAMLAPQHPAFAAMQLQAHEITSALRRIHAEMNKLNLSPSQMPAPVLKAATGELAVTPVADSEQLRWFVVYSNNTLDDDYPADILSAQAQHAYAYLTKEGAVPMPELWIWHLPGTRLGTADLVDTVEIDGITFAYATGLTDAGQAPVLQKAQALGLTHVSHGAPVAIRRVDDHRVVDFYASRELSLLPYDRAANKHTGLILKGDPEMALSQEQRDKLTQLYADKPEMVDEIEQALNQLQASAAARETKEATEPPADPPAAPAPETPAYVTREEMEGLLTTLATQLNALNDRLGELQKAQTPVPAAEPEAPMTPQASLSDLLTGMLAFQKEAVVKPDTSLAKAAPEQAPAVVKGVTGIDFLDQWIQ